MIQTTLCSIIIITAMTVNGFAGDWPSWGKEHSRNMVSDEKNIPDDFNIGKFKKGTEEVDLSTTTNVKWVTKLGSQAYGNTTVSNGRIFIGTNNETPRDPRHVGDRGIVMCLDEATGEFLWQLVVPKLGAGKVSDWEYLGICSSPAVDGDYVYVVTNRCEVVCLDVHGLANGNDGPFQDEAAYVAGPDAPPIEPGPMDADIIWRFDMRDELGVFPHNIASSSVLVLGDKLFVTTSNGQDWSHLNIPSPLAPCLVVLDKKTGALLGEEASGISKRLMHCNWSSPAFGHADGQDMVIFGAGDGYCYGFDPNPVLEDDGLSVLQELWRIDCVPDEYKQYKYPSAKGPSEIISTPVFYNNRVYAAIGQDPEHGNGVGQLVCIDPSQRGDISGDGIVWSYKDISRTISTPSIADGLLYIVDYGGIVHCLDADSGELYWTFDTESNVWGSTLVVDGKVFISNEDGFLYILKTGKNLELLNTIDMGAPVYSTPIVANGVFYIATQTHLYAVSSSSEGD
jgi:outer membrane protein assembly factor BamB